jgi:hypothetical protein
MSTTKKVVWGVVAVLVVVGALARNSEESQSVATESAGAPQPTLDPKAAYKDSLDFDFSWSLGGFDNVMVGNFTFTNKGSRAVKDLEMSCALEAKSGTPIDAVQQVIYEVVPANGKKRVADFNMGIVNTQVSSANCRIRGFAFVE